MAKKDSFFRRLFRLVWRSITILYALLVLAMVVIVPLVFYFAYLSTGAVEVEQDTALVWAPSGALVEQRDNAVPDNLLGSLLGGADSEAVVRDLIEALDRAASDSRIKFVFLKLDELGAATPGQLEGLAAAIDRFKNASNKQVVAWSPTYNQAQYRLAAHADEIYLDPLGYVFLEGFGVFRKYFAEGLDKLGVRINVFRVGEYKSFVEPFVRNDMSPAARASNRAWLGSLWQAYEDGVVTAAGLPEPAIEDYIAGLDAALAERGGDAAQLALDAGLVDKLAGIQTMREAMGERVGIDDSHGSFRQIHHREYLRATESEQVSPRTDSNVGLVVVEGAIIDGESTAGAAGGDTVVRLIDRARRDDRTAALVLRINSPGGSVYASERIRRAVLRVREAGKPVLVSMAGTAASGGYWIAMNADRILAHRSTITGSIGVFGVVPTYAEPLAKIGIHTDGLGTTPLAGALRGDRPLQPQIKRILQSGVEHLYNRFIGLVAEARGMAPDAVDKIAQGRVWSGIEARRIGLVDEFGGLNQAVAVAAEMAGLADGDYAIKPIRPPSNWRALFFQLFNIQSALPDWLARLPADPVFNWLGHGLNDPRGVYAHCFCELAPADAAP